MSAVVVLLAGLPLDDPYVIDTLAEEIPAMIKLQHHILATSEWRLFVSEQQLQHACKMIEIASGNSSSGSLDTVQDLVQRKARQYQVWRDETMAALHLQQQQSAVQLFPGEVVMGMLTEVTGPADVAAEEGGQALHDTQAAAPHEALQPKQQQRCPLQDISNVCYLQPSNHSSDSAAAKAPFNGLGGLLEPQQQQQQQQPRTRQQQKLFQQRKDSGGEHPRPVTATRNAAAASAGPQGSRQAKSQLLQLASREQAVGSKRRRSMSTAAAVPPRQPLAAAAAGTTAAGEKKGMQQQQQGGLGVLGAGGKHILLKVMRTARSAAHYLGCGPQ
jgi:hypothetical protein